MGILLPLLGKELHSRVVRSISVGRWERVLFMASLSTCMELHALVNSETVLHCHSGVSRNPAKSNNSGPRLEFIRLGRAEVTANRLSFCVLSYSFNQTGRPRGQRLGCFLSLRFHSSIIPIFHYSFPNISYTFFLLIFR